MKNDCSRINEDFFNSRSDVTDVDADLVDRTMLVVYTTTVSNVCKKHVKNEILHRCSCADMNKCQNDDSETIKKKKSTFSKT